MRSLAPYLCLLFALLFGSARAQEVREESSGHGSSLRAATNLAKKEGKTGFPDLYDGDAGTVVLATFDLRNADLTLITEDATPERLLKSAQAAAQEAGYPQADFLTFSGTRSESVDIELNDSLVRRGDARTEIALPLGRIVRALERARVPKPIALAVVVDPLTTATLDGKPLPVGTRLLVASEIAEGATLARVAERPPWAKAVAYGAVALLGAIALGMYAIPIVMIVRPPKPKIEPDTIPNPEEIQAKYDGAKIWMRLLPIFMLLPFLLVTLGKTQLEYIFAAIGTVFSAPPLWSSFAIFLPYLVLMPLASLLKRRREKANPPAIPAVHPEDDESNPFKSLIFLPIALVPMMAFPFLMIAFPKILRGLDPMVRFAVLLVPMVLFASGMIIAVLRSSRARVTTLEPGDTVHDAARELASQAGVKVRKVQVKRSAAPNAFADLANNVGVTTRLKRDFPPEEVRAILAHEIGHLRHRHVRRGFALSLLFLGAWLGLWFSLDGWVKTHTSEGVYALWNSPLWGLFVIPLLARAALGRGSRRRELEADRFAVEAVGDPEIVASALRRVHTLSGTPGRLRPEDELLSTHPSLARRIAALTSSPPSG